MCDTSTCLVAWGGGFHVLQRSSQSRCSGVNMWPCRQAGTVLYTEIGQLLINSWTCAERPLGAGIARSRISGAKGHPVCGTNETRGVVWGLEEQKKTLDLTMNWEYHPRPLPCNNKSSGIVEEVSGNQCGASTLQRGHSLSIKETSLLFSL